MLQISCLLRPVVGSSSLGFDIDHIELAEHAAQQIDDDTLGAVEPDEMSLLYLANAGTGAGGARPKALLYDERGQYLAKFNRLRADAYNNAQVELACLLMADVIKQHSVNVEEGLTQLLRLMFFNRAIHNTDDHERNFSLIYNGEGYELAPAYDLVPSLTVGEYHAAGYQYALDPPRPSEADRLGKVFGLPKPVVRRAAEQVIATVSRWKDFAAQAGVSSCDADSVGGGVIKL